jgi:ankyrin repeat protein
MDIFQYSPINLEGLSFRLVRLHPGTGENIEVELIHAMVDDDEMIPYEAVSYTWGSPDKPHVVYIQGTSTTKPVTENLYRILLDLRFKEEDRYLWIDAICINQDDTMERNHQVKQMGDIYNRAERVLFYLGRPTKATQIVMESLAKLKKRCDLNWERDDKRWEIVWDGVKHGLIRQHSGIHKTLRQGIRYLLDQPWFSRVWILQEVANARAAWVYCGTKHIPARLFALSPRLFGITPNSHCQAVLDMMPTKSRTESQWSKGQDLYHLLLKFAKAKAQDNRDKIYALYGMCINGKGKGTLVADYEKDISEVILETISFICFCSKDMVPKRLCSTIEGFIRILRSLHTIVLEEMIRQWQTDSIKSLLLERGEYIIITPKMVGVATEAGHKDVLIHLLFDNGLKADTRGPNIEKSLWRAVGERDNKDLVELLLNKGAEVNAKDPDGKTPLWIATENGRKGIIQLLLDHGAEVDAKARNGTLLWGEMERGKGYNDLVQPLLDHSAEIDTKTQDGKTPLWGAVEIGLKSVVELLLDHGAEVDTKTQDGKTPLWRAVQTGQKDVVELLLDHGAEVDTKAQDGKTPLWRAVEIGQNDVVELLLDHGAEVDATDTLGRTPLLRAVENGHNDTIQLLLDNGANIDTRDTLGRTPLLRASQIGYKDIIRLLLDNGAKVGTKELIWAWRWE